MDRLDVVKFVSDNKREIAGTAIAGVIGIIVGIVGHRMVVHKRYGELDKILLNYKGRGQCSEDVLVQIYSDFLKHPTKSVQLLTPVANETIGDTFNERMIWEFKEHFGYEPTDKISGIVIGIKRD